MAGTIHRDPTKALIRKIGYSVGLERTLDRVRDMVELYARELSLTSSGMSNLISSESGWKLRSDNILDVFGSLGLIKNQSNTIFVLPALDALAILRVRLPDTDFDVALRAVLLNLILSSDGDIFLNCLSVGFEKCQVREALTSMVEGKRQLARQVIKSPVVWAKAERAICIEAQKTNRGGSAQGRGIEALRRREPLSEARGSLAPADEAVSVISDDYLRKVPPRRRDWAQSLELADDDGNSTSAGRRLLNLFNDLGQRVPDAYSFWPYDDELLPLNLQSVELPWRTPDRDAVSYGLKAVITGVQFGSNLATPQATAAWLNDLFALYRTLNPSRSIVRVELPLETARLVALGTACAAGGADHDPLHAARIIEGSGGTIGFRPSRNTEGSIIFRGR